MIWAEGMSGDKFHFMNEVKEGMLLALIALLLIIMCYHFTVDHAEVLTAPSLCTLHSAILSQAQRVCVYLLSTTQPLRNKNCNLQQLTENHKLKAIIAYLFLFFLSFLIVTNLSEFVFICETKDTPK